MPNASCIDELVMDCSPPADGQEGIRFWESARHCVVLGRSCRVEKDVDIAACDRDGVPILRRESGGGTVLLGPGSLNYRVAQRATKGNENVSGSYCEILRAIASRLKLDGMQVAGSDLLWNDRKVSGNAQRRTGGWVLHHGTLLYEMNLPLVTRYLKEPARRPEHRGSRTHEEFLVNLPLSRETIVERLARLY